MLKSIYNSHFFPRTSQGHNALPQPGLEPGSSDSEPSALTTGLLDKAVAPCAVVRSYIYVLH